MEPELILEAKNIVQKKYGSALAQKASESFCIHLAGFRAGAESYEGTQNTVIEFSELHGTSSSHIITPTRVSAAVISKVQASLGEVTVVALPHIARNASAVLKQKRIIEQKNASLQNMVSVHNHLNKWAWGRSRENEMPEVCWLNESIVTKVDKLMLAEIASDNNISQFDIPRPLFPDIYATGRMIEATAFRERYPFEGTDVIIAVVDGEIDTFHAAFRDRVVPKGNFTKEPWGRPFSHATAVAGIIASSDETYIGMAPGAMIYNYKVLATNNALGGNDINGAQALEQALLDGVDIANCSWGSGPARDGKGREARGFDKAWNLGITIVKSAGNLGPDEFTLTAPADAAGVIVVGATDKDCTTLAEYSSVGPLRSGDLRPHLLAPGGTPANGILSCMDGGFGNVGCGTSFAAPHVTGLIALLLEKKLVSDSPEEIRNFLINNLCVKLNGVSKNAQGAGVISLATLLASN